MEPGPSATPLAVLLGRMRASGLDVHVAGVMDALWLALQPGLTLGSDEPATEAKIPANSGAGASTTGPSPLPNVGTGGANQQARGATQPERPAAEQLSLEKTNAYSTRAQPGDTDALPASPLRIPAGVALANKLPLTRALRPLRKWFRQGLIQELNEEATVEETARAGGLMMPVLQPRRERWYELVVVSDSGPSMDVWIETMREFESVARTSGVFRDIRRFQLRWKPELPQPHPEEGAVLEGADGAVSRAVTLAQTNVRRLVLLATNGSGRYWTDGRMSALLQLWSRQCSVAVLQMLPEHLWERVRTGEPGLMLRTLTPGAATGALEAQALWWEEDLEDAEGNALKRVPGAVPILALEASWMGKWARMQMGGGQGVPGIAIGVKEEPAPRKASERTPHEWAGAVEAFTRSSSPETRTLAVYLSRGSFTLPVARLVQSTMLGAKASQVQLAEILLSGLVQRTTSADEVVPPEWVEYQFHAEPTKILGRGLRESDADLILDALEKHIERTWGKAADFSALIYDPEGLAKIPRGAQPFARLGSVLTRQPDEEELLDQARPAIFLMWDEPRRRPLACMVAAGLRRREINVLISGRSRIPKRGGILLIAEKEPDSGHLTDEMAMAIESGLDGMILAPAGVAPTGSSYVFWDSYGDAEAVYDALAAKIRAINHDPAPSVRGAPLLDRTRALASVRHLDSLRIKPDAPPLVVYGNVQYDARASVRDIVWIRDLRLQFPAGVRWLQPGAVANGQRGELLILEKWKTPVAAFEGGAMILIDPEFAAAAGVAEVAEVYEGLAKGSKVGDSPHLKYVAETLGMVSVLEGARDEPLGSTFSTILWELTLRTDAFEALDGELRRLAGMLGTLREDSVDVTRRMMKPEQAMLLVPFDLAAVDAGGVHPTETGRFLMRHLPGWQGWNLSLLELFGLERGGDWLSVAQSGDDYIRRNVVAHAVPAQCLDDAQRLVSTFSWWVFRAGRDGGAALLDDLKSFEIFREFLAGVPDLGSMHVDAMAAAIESCQGDLPEILRLSVRSWLDAQNPAPSLSILLVLPGNTSETLVRTAEAFAGLAARRGVGLVCDAPPEIAESCVAAYDRETHGGAARARVSTEHLRKELEKADALVVPGHDDAIYKLAVEMRKPVHLLGETSAPELIDQIFGSFSAPTEIPPARNRLRQQWRAFLGARDHLQLLDWRSETPKMGSDDIVQCIVQSDAAERITGYTSFWLYPDAALASRVAMNAVHDLKEAHSATERYILLGICTLVLLEPDLFPGDDFPPALEAALEIRGGRWKKSRRGTEVIDRIRKLNHQLEAWKLASRPQLSEDDERRLGQIPPAHGKYELQCHLKRGPGAPYRLYAYAVLMHSPDISLLDPLLECLDEREDRMAGLAMGLRAVEALTALHQLSDAQQQILASIRRRVTAVLS